MQSAEGTTPRPSLLQVLAHPDDDLYFINPDLQRALEAGHRVTSVYLTAAEADGRNIDTRDPHRLDSPPDYAGYVEARQQGLRAAYAAMVTGDRESGWARDAVSFAAGVAAERSTLLAAPHVQLFFFGLRMVDTEHGFADVPPARLATLWTGRSATQLTLNAADSPLGPAQGISRDTLHRCLTELLHHTRPDQYWTMDPDPWHGEWDEVRGPTSSDHPDHTATAQFALGALDRYLAEGGAPPLVGHCVGYGNKLSPSNLTEHAWAEKKRVIEVYTAADGHDCRRRYCGDRQLADGSDIRRYGWSTRSRYEGGTDWLHLQADGRLAAYAVLGDRVAVWTESAPGSDTWDRPILLPGGRLTPALSVAPDRDGGVHLVGMRRTPGPGGRVDVEVVRMWRQAHTGATTSWESVGNPNEGSRDWQRCREVGVPEAVVDPSQRLHVFMRNFGAGISARRETAEGWGAWEDLGGRGMQDCLTAVLKSTGRVQLFAANRVGALHWYQEDVYGPYRLRDGVTQADPDAWRPVGGITPVQVGRSRMAVVYREEDSGEVMCVRQRPDGRWHTRAERLGGHGGTGRIAALRQFTDRHDTLVLARRNARNGLSVAVLATQDRDPAPEWADHDVLMARPPALALDCSGRIVVAVLGTDARLRVMRQKTPDPAEGFGPLTMV